MLLKEIKTTDLDPNKKYTFVLAMGATEQHGPFLPIGTDTYCQAAILEEAIADCPHAIFLPILEISCSKEHQGFIGTVWIEKETMMLMLRDIAQSLKAYASNIIFTSWHGGNLGTIDLFIRENQSRFESVKLHHVSLDPPDILKKIEQIIEGPVDEHAGNTEISMTLTVQENLVKIPSADYPKHNIIVDWNDGHPLKEQSSDGIADSHPRWVISKEQGKLFIELSAKHLKNEIHRIMS